VGDEHIQFVETAWIEQEIETLARSEFTLFMLIFDPSATTAESGLFGEFAKFRQLLCCTLRTG
jgi:hypothetical protein